MAGLDGVNKKSLTWRSKEVARRGFASYRPRMAVATDMQQSIVRRGIVPNEVSFVSRKRTFLRHFLMLPSADPWLSFLFWDSVFRRGAARDAVGHNQKTIGLHVLGQYENGFRFCTIRHATEHAEPGRRSGLAVPEE